MEYNLLIIGAGQLGSRHLQALAQLDDQFSVYVLDPSERSLEVAQLRYQEVVQESSPDVTYLSDIDNIAGMNIDVCIVATNADIRLGIIKQLVDKLKVKHLILEKVLFQSVEQLVEAEEILDRSGINTWVNCPRRQFIEYQDLVRTYQDAKSISIDVRGFNWGLACNAIHFIDLWNYFADFSDYTLDFETDVRIIDSKRAGFKEIIGGLSAQSGRHNLSLRCDQEDNGQVVLDISLIIDGERIELSEREGAIRWLLTDGTIIKELPLQVLFQSQLSNKVVLDLITKQDCELTSLATSIMLHTEFLRKAATLFAPSVSSELKQLVPIT